MPPKQAKDQTKSTPTSKSANEKDTIKGLKKLVESLEKEKGTWEKTLKEKNEEIERLKVVQGFCGEGDNVSTTPITNSRDLRSAPAANGTIGEGNIQDQIKEIKRLTEENKKLKEELQNINVTGQTDNGSNQTNNNSRETRSAPAANGTIGEGNIQDQSKETKRLTEENKKLKEELKKVKKEDTSLCSQVSLSDIPLEGLIDDSSNQTNNNSRETRSAPAANDTTGEGNIQDQSKEIKRLTLENEQLNEKLNKLTRENEELNEKFNKSKEEKRNSQKPELNGENKNLESKISQLKDEIKNLNSQNEKLKDEIKNLNSQNEKLTEENEQEKQKLYKEEKKNLELTQKIEELNNKLSQQENENKKSGNKSPTEENKNLELKQIENLQKKIAQQEQESKDKLLKEEGKNSKLTQMIKNLEKTLEQQEQESKDKLLKEEGKNSELTQMIKNLEKTLEQQEQESKDKLNKEKKISELTKKIEVLQKTLEQKEKESKDKSNSPKSAACRNLKDAEAQVKQLNEKNEKLIEEKNKAVKEVDNLKNRLSQIAGSKLTDNNPGIADLSDPNRPLNLGEKFSELYDNQWTDAMEEMTCTMDEKQAIELLLKIVNYAYEFCVNISDGYCKQIEAAITKLFNTELSSLQKKLTKDYRKSMAVYLVSDLEEEFCKTYKYDGKAVKSYQKQCIRVCWFMAVQDPKVFIDVEDVSGKKFEDDKYKHYTKTGKVTDYLVWPVLYLHKGGPMLGKGVAQGK